MKRMRLLLLLLLIPTLPAAAAKAPVYSSWLGVAINGHDPVAYFTESRPVPGEKRHRAEYRGAEWYFASAENRRRFVENPERYAPRYGGYCAWAVANGYTASTDPDAWTIHDGKLYLNYSRSVQAQWDQAREENIRKADGNWPSVLD